MNKPTANYWVDVIIGAAFVISGISGLVFLVPSGAADGTSLVGLSIRAWSDLHTWSGIVMIAGVGVHLALHWKWIWHMTKRKLRAPIAASHISISWDAVARQNTELARDSGYNRDRREFLKLGGAATLATGLVVAGFRFGTGHFAPASGDTLADAERESQQPGSVISDGAEDAFQPAAESSGSATERADSTESDGSSASQPATSTEIQAGQGTASDPELQRPQGVACRFGGVDDPYPGQCRHYVDSNGNGICDYSVLGSGNVQASGSRRS